MDGRGERSIRSQESFSSVKDRTLYPHHQEADAKGLEAASLWLLELPAHQEGPSLSSQQP
jgi:hypothetical protein